MNFKLNKSKKANQTKFLLSIATIGLPILLNAQPYPPPPDLGDGQVYDVPFDDNVIILVIVAVLYGLQRAWRFKKNQKNKKMLLQN
ncbi:MAG: hypothetical protein JWR18_1013 [Segetibacter sp.]|jgi:hypothetical protein|nr:hypothetical protein [Segetibacter sp.]